MEDHPNIEVFKRAYEAFTSGDMDALANVFAEDVVWHTPGRNPISGNHRGREAAFASFEKEFELSDGTYHPVAERRRAMTAETNIVALESRRWWRRCSRGSTGSRASSEMPRP